jgi:hypothetical protein
MFRGTLYLPIRSMIAPSRGIIYLDLANSRSDRADEKMIAGICGSQTDVLRQLTRICGSRMPRSSRCGCDKFALGRAG